MMSTDFAKIEKFRCHCNEILWEKYQLSTIQYKLLLKSCVVDNDIK